MEVLEFIFGCFWDIFSFLDNLNIFGISFLKIIIILFFFFVSFKFLFPHENT